MLNDWVLGVVLFTNVIKVHTFFVEEPKSLKMDDAYAAA